MKLKPKTPDQLAADWRGYRLTGLGVILSTHPLVKEPEPESPHAYFFERTQEDLMRIETMYMDS